MAIQEFSLPQPHVSQAIPNTNSSAQSAIPVHGIAQDEGHGHRAEPLYPRAGMYQDTSITSNSIAWISTSPIKCTPGSAEITRMIGNASETGIDQYAFYLPPNDDVALVQNQSASDTEQNYTAFFRDEYPRTAQQPIAENLEVEEESLHEYLGQRSQSNWENAMSENERRAIVSRYRKMCKWENLLAVMAAVGMDRFSTEQYEKFRSCMNWLIGGFLRGKKWVPQLPHYSRIGRNLLPTMQKWSFVEAATPAAEIDFSMAGARSHTIRCRGQEKSHF